MIINVGICALVCMLQLCSIYFINYHLAKTPSLHQISLDSGDHRSQAHFSNEIIIIQCKMMYDDMLCFIVPMGRF